MSIKKVCDICGRDMSLTPMAIIFDVRITMEGLRRKNLDVCKDCMNKFKTWVKSEVEE